MYFSPLATPMRSTPYSDVSRQPVLRIAIMVAGRPVVGVLRHPLQPRLDMIIVNVADAFNPVGGVNEILRDEQRGHPRRRHRGLLVIMRLELGVGLSEYIHPAVGLLVRQPSPAR